MGINEKSYPDITDTTYHCRACPIVYGAGEQGDVRLLAGLPSRLPLPSSSLHAHLYLPYFLKVLTLASDTYIRPNIKQTNREPDGASDGYTRGGIPVSLSTPIPPESSSPWQTKRGQLAEAPWSVDSTAFVTHGATHRPSRSGRTMVVHGTDYLVMVAVSAVIVYLWMQ
jgi:hypothetical protein